MSIIYDALNKIQKQRRKRLTAIAKRIVVDMKMRKVMIVSLLITLAFVLIMLFQRAIIQYSALALKKTTEIVTTQAASVRQLVDNLFSTNKVVVAQKPSEYLRSHFLNGIFISDSMQAVMINKKLFYLGDSVDGLKIIAIDNQSVTLLNGEKTLVLHMTV